MTTPTDATVDQRARRTREAIFRAFFGLVLEQRYDAIRIADILARADIGRSTFYEHFRNKDALLEASLEHPFAALADSVVAAALPPSLTMTMIIEHFAQNSRVVLCILQGATRRHAQRTLARLIEQRLRGVGLARPGAMLLPPGMAAQQIGEAILVPLTAWLQAPGGVGAPTLALALHRSVRGLVSGLCDVRMGCAQV